MQQQQQQPYIPRRRVILLNDMNRTRADEFYTKLERVRSSAAAFSSSRQYPQRTAAELLNESKRFFVKSEQVLRNRQTPSNDDRMIPTFRSAQPRRFPYHADVSEDRFDDSLRTSTPPPTNTSDSAFESISVLSLSDQTTLDSTNNPSPIQRTVTSSSITVIERNARIIKWLFHLHQANQSPS